MQDLTKSGFCLLEWLDNICSIHSLHVVSFKPWKFTSISWVFVLNPIVSENARSDTVQNDFFPKIFIILLFQLLLFDYDKVELANMNR